MQTASLANPFGPRYPEQANQARIAVVASEDRSQRSTETSLPLRRRNVRQSEYLVLSHRIVNDVELLFIS